MREGRIDIIVVCKVDRLTRSLLDFAKLVEEIDAVGVSFVSVIQSFNATAFWMIRVLRLVFLSPPVTEAILTGRQKADVDGTMLLAQGVIKCSWDAQDAPFLVQAG